MTDIYSIKPFIFTTLQPLLLFFIFATALFGFLVFLLWFFKKTKQTTFIINEPILPADFIKTTKQALKHCEKLEIKELCFQTTDIIKNYWSQKQQCNISSKTTTEIQISDLPKKIQKNMYEYFQQIDTTKFSQEQRDHDKKTLIQKALKLII
ncbi:hypothetical protein COB57_02055 [Candidatus Peregrinibacteria bacterium]|nr:MAG: hypothetical protein COB57_02055 [Candidatus Peregrinibacteria bacterium]